ncbi:MAG: glycosyltransferase family 4 protein [Bdellovibrionales bacterium]|nr:glycosyltransferase family 4 protein [Bdellovibrionales bacterium]
MSASAQEPLNICIVSRRFPLLNNSGEIGFLFPIARGLVRQGHKVTVLSWRNKNRLDVVEVGGVKAYFLGEGNAQPADAFPEQVLRKFQQLHKQEPFHLVHSLDNSGFEVGRRRKELGVAVVYDVDATHMAQVYSILGMSQETLGSLIKTSWRVTMKFLKTYWRYDRRLLKTADAVFVHSPQQRVMLERYYVYPDQRIFTVPLGIEAEDLSPRERSEELMKKLGLPVNAQNVVTVTDMAELGEMRNLLHAFERVAIKKPTARLIVVGTGPLKKEIEFEMLSLALGSRVVFTGEILASQLAEHIALADVFVNLSARSSGIEQSLLEAMAQKKIIIGSEVSPLGDVVEDGIDGFLIRPADTFTLSELLLQVFNGQISGVEMGEQARQKVLNLFDADKMLAQTLLAYRQARQRFVTAHRGLFSLPRPLGSP